MIDKGVEETYWLRSIMFETRVLFAISLQQLLTQLSFKWSISGQRFVQCQTEEGVVWRHQISPSFSQRHCSLTVTKWWSLCLIALVCMWISCQIVPHQSPFDHFLFPPGFEGSFFFLVYGRLHICFQVTTVASWGKSKLTTLKLSHWCRTLYVARILISSDLHSSRHMLSCHFSGFFGSKFRKSKISWFPYIQQFSFNLISLVILCILANCFKLVTIFYTRVLSMCKFEQNVIYMYSAVFLNLKERMVFCPKGKGLYDRYWNIITGRDSPKATHQ